jgi:hypothetical protein
MQLQLGIEDEDEDLILGENRHMIMKPAVI